VRISIDSRAIAIALLQVGILLAVFAFAVSAAAQSGGPLPDKYAWLEDINGEKPLAWVKEHDARTAAVLEKDPHFASLESDALTVLASQDRVPYPVFLGNDIYNLWQDSVHLHGIFRRTTLADYLAASPKWETVVDYDALGKQDNQSWSAKEIHCLHPQDELCMVELSAGGEDAVSEREMNLKTGKFVETGFVLPRGKQNEDWLDKDTLLIARDWGPGTMSEAGYPITVRMWKRGQPQESAKEVFRGDAKDSSVSPASFDDGEGHRGVMLERDLTFFEIEWNLLTPNGIRKLALPKKSHFEGFVDNQLIFSLHEDWTPTGEATALKMGSVISFDLDLAGRDPDHLKPTVVFSPTSQEFEQQIATTRHHLLMAALDHVQGRAYVYTRQKDGQWTRRKLPVAANQTVFVASASQRDDHFFLVQTGFLNPDSLWLGDASTATLKLAKRQKGLFDASNDVVEQWEATSKDGTKVPYFIVHRKDMPYDGNNPTLITAYGGFEVPVTPYYDTVVGKLWLEHGGVFVSANIRGGGEFGPAWHEAGLKTHRQRIYDDFYGVAQDLVTRKVTSPRRLGIFGGSNAGLLMGVEFTQHPEMWSAVSIEVPLLDMLGYEHMSAGASWVGEYGSASVPGERTFLASISPYQNLKRDGHYPEPLIFTTTKDDRVGPVHARKFAALMEEYNLPFYYDEITAGGHGDGDDKKQEARTNAEKYTYFMRKLMN
jgi:prolyl oligopeptidase